MKPKALITAPCHTWLTDKLSETYTVDYQPAITYDELKSIINNYEGLIVTTRLKIDIPVIDSANNLKWIGRLGSGLELIDVPYAETKNIKVVSSPEGNRLSVAEHTLGLALSLFHIINQSANEVKQLQWIRDVKRSNELTGKTVGIIGFGNTGSEFARLLEPFKVTVLAHDKYKTGFGNHYIKEASLEDIFLQADLVSMHIPLTPETQYYANKAFFNQFQKQPFFITTCRGKVTNGLDLLMALQNKQLSGAALDVIENEKLSTLTPAQEATFKGLLALPNVIITPHIAGYSNDAFYKMATVIYQKLNIS